MSDKLKYVLSKPLKFGEKTYESFELHRPQAKHLKDLPLDTKSWTGSHMIVLISELTAEPEPLIGTLPIPEILKMMEFIAPFLGGSPGTGS